MQNSDHTDIQFPEFYFMPFSDLELSDKVPVVAYAFEGQEDTAIDKEFPEIEHLRKVIDKNEDNEADTVLFFPIQRKEKMYLAGIVYCALSWKKKRRKFDIDSINFYKVIKERSVVMTEYLRELCHEEAIILLPGQFHPKNIRNRKQKEQLLLFVQTLTESIIYGNSTLDDFKEKPLRRIKRVTFTYFGTYEQRVDNFFQKAIGDGYAVGSALAYTRRLIELPPNHKYPSEFIKQAAGFSPVDFFSKDDTGKSRWHLVRQHDFSRKTTKVSVVAGLDSLRNYGKHGFGLIAGVGQGSVHEPCLLKVHYKPSTRRKKPVKRVTLIGKGVTFDTGGVDLKLTGSYDKMHYDMAGAATILGAIKLAEEKNLPVEIIGLAPIVHNAIGPDAIHPHDILTSYSGKSVEIINTDSEGRLILADALAYSEKEICPDCTITVATLCNIEDITLDIIKVLSTSDALEKKVRLAEDLAMEKVILWPNLEYLNALDDEYVNGTDADLMNEISFGYHSSGIVFIADFLDWEKPLNWIYVDISAVFHEDAPDYCAGPGFGLRLMWNILKQFA